MANLTDQVKRINNLVDTLARSMRPTNFRDMLGIAAELWLGCPPYRQAIIRGTSFFMTELEITGDGGVEGKAEEIKQARELMNSRFAATEQPLLVLQEAMGFGGSCAYLQFPVDRIITCQEKGCGTTLPLASAMNDHAIRFDLSDGTYKGPCPGCRKQQIYEVTDARRPDQAKDARLRRIPLALCRQNVNPLTGERELYIDCSKWDMFARGVKDGDPLFHRSTPGLFIESARTGREVRMSDKYFHYVGFEDASLIDMHLDGWSLPPFFYAFPDVVAILLLQKYNQTVLSDYILPFRYVAPPPTVGVARNMGGSGAPFDPTHSSTGNFRDFSVRVASFIRTLKENPELIGISPYPIQFGYLGLDGKQMLNEDIMQHYVDSLMYNMGIPPEFYRGGIGAQVAAPSHYGWTLYIRFWRPLVSAINRLNQWTTDRISEVQRWPKLIARMVPPTTYADPGMLPILLQRNQEGKLSDDTLDRVLGVATDYEQRTVEHEQQLRENRAMDLQRTGAGKQMVQQILADVSPDMQAMNQMAMAQQQQQMGAIPGGSALAGVAGPPMAGAPVSGSTAVPVSPVPVNPGSPEGTPQAGVTPAETQSMQTVMAKAQQTAQMLLSTYPNVTDRANMLRQLDAAQPQFAMFVRDALGQLEDEARKQGLQAARGGGGGAPA